MALLTIAKLGNPLLRQVAPAVDPNEIGTRAFQQFIDDMFETMQGAEGIGLAAPQVSRSQ
ncbi:MAG: peptide deformylase, partial [Nitrospiraceae bacterium]